MRERSRLREVWELKRGLAVAFAVALLAAISSVSRISLLPPKIAPRSLTIGAATTQLLVDTPSSKILDLHATYVDFTTLTARADLLGNLMVSQPILALIARYVGVKPSEIQATAPPTANVPRVVIEPGSGQSANDIVASADRYRLQVQADPSVPILRIYTQAPTAAKAVALANASARGLTDYLTQLAGRQSIPVNAQLRVEQFGGAYGGVANPGFAPQIAFLTFLVTFSVSCVVVVSAAHARRRWQLWGASSPARS